MATLRSSPADPQHIEPALRRERDSSTSILEPGPATSRQPTPWSPARSHVCEQRSARTQSSYLRTDSAHADLNFRVRLVRSPIFFLESRPKNSRKRHIGSNANMAIEFNLLN